MTTLAKCPDDRFPSAEALAAALVPFASAEGIAGPFSLRPSRRAFEIASSAMARVPAGARASDAYDLLRLPTSRTTRRVHRESSAWTPARTFVGTLTIGFAVAAGAAVGAHHSIGGDRAHVHPAPSAGATAVLQPIRTEPAPVTTPPTKDESPPTAAVETLPVAAVPSHGASLTLAARPRPSAQPGVPPAAAPHAAPTISSAQRERNAPAHAPVDTPLYL
jgi:hypothetical protein